MRAHMIERGSPEHLRAVVDAHRDTLRMVNAMTLNIRKALDMGDMEMALLELDAIATLTDGYDGSGGE